VLVVCIGERRVGEECELGGELETACLLCWPWKGGGLCEGYGCGRRAGTERFLCLCLGGHVGQVGGVGNWFGERVGRVGGRERGARCWGFDQGWRLGESSAVARHKHSYIFQVEKMMPRNSRPDAENLGPICPDTDRRGSSYT
jgi:hypothetical protein